MTYRREYLQYVHDRILSALSARACHLVNVPQPRFSIHSHLPHATPHPQLYNSKTGTMACFRFQPRSCSLLPVPFQYKDICADFENPSTTAETSRPVGHIARCVLLLSLQLNCSALHLSSILVQVRAFLTQLLRFQLPANLQPPVPLLLVRRYFIDFLHPS